MTVSLTHAFVSTLPDDNRASTVGSTEWNEEHTLTAATSKLLGTTALSTTVTEITIGTGLTLTGSTLSAAAASSVEGTNVLSTGEVGGSKFLRENGDGTCSWQATPGGGDALTASPLSQFAATTSAQLAGVISDETGSGALVFANTPTLVTPVLGTPGSGTLTNCTGLPISTGVSGLGTGVATALGNALDGASGLMSYDADTLKADTADQLTAAFTAAVDDDGTQSSGTYTPSVSAGTNYKKIVNGGAFTLAPISPATGEAITLSLLVVNTTGAGAITTSGFTKVTGDSFTTTTTDEFLCRIEVYDIGGTEYSHLDVVALQ